MSLGGLEAVFRVEFIRLTLECPWDVGPLPTSAATGAVPVSFSVVPGWWLTCGQQFNSCWFFPNKPVVLLLSQI